MTSKGKSMNCENCRIGRFQPISAPYLRWLGDRIMVIPDAPANTCDICGKMTYDAGFISKLQLLLDQLTDDDESSIAAMEQVAIFQR
jgi:YgiT-type zinc finger domain-containing protein